MKLFVRNLCLFTITFVLASGTIILLERMILNKQKRFVLPPQKKYLILGHSHGEAAYNDKLIDSSQNLCISGESYFYTFIKLRKILENNTNIKGIFVEYCNNNIIDEMNKWTWDDVIIQARYKLYSAYAGIDEVKLLYSKNSKSAFVCDMKSIINNLYYIARSKTVTEEGSLMGGYADLHRNVIDSMLSVLHGKKNDNRLDTTLSPVNILYLQKIIAACKQMNVKLFLIRSPLHPMYFGLGGLGNEARFKAFLDTKFAGVEFLDFRDYYAPNNEFGDLEHLNEAGAKRYSLFFNRLLKLGLMEMHSKQEFIDEQISKEKIALESPKP